MAEWDELDCDAWKSDQDPWDDADAWKLNEGYHPGEIIAKKDPRVGRSLSATIGIKPTVKIEILDHTSELVVENREAIKLIKRVANLQKIKTKEGEVFQYSQTRNMWILI